MQLVTHKHRWSVALVALLCVLGMHQSTFAQVLCIGEDGHVEVELASSGCCGEAAEPAQRARNPLLDVEDDDCGDDCGACVDVPLGTNARIASSCGGDRVESDGNRADVLVASRSNFHTSSNTGGHATASFPAPLAGVSSPLIL